jgi:hypothetical protein
MSATEAVTAAPAAAPAEPSSSWGFSMPKLPSFTSSEPELDENGNPVEKKSWLSNPFAGGRRRSKKTRMRGGFRPMMATRSVMLHGAKFGGGRKRKTRRTKRRSRKSSRKR